MRIFFRGGCFTLNRLFSAKSQCESARSQVMRQRAGVKFHNTC